MSKHNYNDISFRKNFSESDICDTIAFNHFLIYIVIIFHKYLLTLDFK